MNKTAQDFFDVLFNKDEWTCFGENKYANATFPISKGYQSSDEFFSINPHQGRSTRAIKNVIAFRNFLFEIDEDSQKRPVPLDVQREIIKSSQLPISACTFSGGKSLHWIVSLMEPMQDYEEYTAVWKSIFDILNKTATDLGYELKFDSSVKDASRFSRVPNSLRMNTKKIQELKGVRGRIQNDLLFNWMETNGKPWQDYMTSYDVDTINEYNLDSTVEERVEWILKYNMKNMEYVHGNKNNYQFTLARLLRATGLTQSEVLSVFNSKFDRVDERDPIGSAFSSKYNSDEKIYVPTREERRRWRHAKELEENAVNVSLFLEESGEETVINSGGIQDYIRVGTKYFNRSGGELELWNSETLKADFGSQAIREFPESQKFTKFVNKIDYKNPVTRVGDKYNLFTKPDWDPKPGEFPTTLTLLSRVFSGEGEDQLEDGLDYIQLALTQPKQNLHALVLTSVHRETGKDTFMEWLQFLVGRQNAYIGMIDEFLSGFNGSFCSKHFICLNEVKISGMNKQAIQKIKTWVTQKTVNRDEKNQPVTTIDYWGRLILATNFAEDFMNIDDEENRFWIRSMPYLDKNGKDYDPHFMEKLEAEVPHFLHFILNRTLKNGEKKSRFWLPQSVTNTQGLRLVQKNNKSPLYYEIDVIIEELFSQTEDDQIYFTTSGMRDALPKNKDFGIKYIKSILEGEWKLTAKKQLRKCAFRVAQKNSVFYEVDRKKYFLDKDTPIEVELPPEFGNLD